MKLSMNRAPAPIDTVSKEDRCKSCRPFHRLVTASALFLTLIALPATAQTVNENIKIVASDAAAGDSFGYSVGVSGNLMIVGARSNNDAGTNSGSAYLIDTTTGQELFKLTASDAAAGDLFGNSVAISGNLAIVGAVFDDDAGSNSGSAYLFDTTTGLQLAKLTASDAAAGDRFGLSVGISGTTAIVGAPLDDDVGTSSGSAYLFDTTTGLQIAKLTSSDTRFSDQFGGSVAISGTTAIIGAAFADNGFGGGGGGADSGSAYLFDTTTGLELAKLIPSDGGFGDNFGNSVAISGTTAIVGAIFDNNGGTDTGSAYLFDTTTGLQLAKLTASDAAAGDNFGNSVAISGNLAIIGARVDDGVSPDSGSAYLFDTITGLQIEKLIASDAAASDFFGHSVAISGATTIVGAMLDDDAGSDSGSAYLFVFLPSILQQPQGVVVTVGQTAVFSVGFAVETGLDFQWRRNGINLVDGGNISGALSSSLQIVATENDPGYYDCVATVISTGATVTSDQAVLGVLPDPNACPADLNGDGLLNFFDVSAFLSAFSAGCP